MGKIKIDTSLFPLSVVQRACYNLLDKATFTIQKGNHEELFVEFRIKRNTSQKDFEDIFHDELIAASVALQNLEKNSELRKYLSRTAFIPIAENVNLLNEILEKRTGEISNGSTEKREENVTKDTDKIRIHEEDHKVFLKLPKHTYLLSDVLRVCWELSHLVHARINSRPPGFIFVELKKKDKIRTSLKQIANRFFQFLNQTKGGYYV